MEGFRHFCASVLLASLVLLACALGTRAEALERVCNRDIDCAPPDASAWCYRSAQCVGTPGKCVYVARCGEGMGACLPREKVCAKCTSDLDCREASTEGRPRPISWCDAAPFCDMNVEAERYKCAMRPRCDPQSEFPVCNATARQCQGLAVLGLGMGALAAGATTTTSAAHLSAASAACTSDACCESMMRNAHGTEGLPWCAGRAVVDPLVRSGCTILPRCPRTTQCQEATRSCSRPAASGEHPPQQSPSSVPSHASSNASTADVFGGEPYVVNSSNMWWWIVILCMALFVAVLLSGCLFVGFYRQRLDAAALNIVLPEEAPVTRLRTTPTDDPSDPDHAEPYESIDPVIIRYVASPFGRKPRKDD